VEANADVTPAPAPPAMSAAAATVMTLFIELLPSLTERQPARALLTPT
jgi:hypothetical protein